MVNKHIVDQVMVDDFANPIIISWSQCLCPTNLQATTSKACSYSTLKEIFFSSLSTLNIWVHCNLLTFDPF